MNPSNLSAISMYLLRFVSIATNACFLMLNPPRSPQPMTNSELTLSAERTLAEERKDEEKLITKRIKARNDNPYHRAKTKQPKSLV